MTELRALAQLASLSKFVDATNNTNAEDYILAAMLALGVKLRTAQQRLLREETISLKEFTNLASAVESAEADQHVISGSKISVVAQRSSRPTAQGGVKRDSTYAAKGRSQSRTRTPDNVCMRCGRSGRHKAPEKCPAIQSECSKCGKKGHFARICQATTSGATTAISTVSFADNTPAVSEHKIAPAHSCLKRSITTAIWSVDSVTHIANGWKFDLKFILPHGQTFTLPTKLDTDAKATQVQLTTTI